MSLESKMNALRQNEAQAWEQPRMYTMENGKNAELEEAIDRGDISRIKHMSDETVDELARMKYPEKLYEAHVRDEFRKDLADEGLDYGVYTAFDDRAGRKHLVHYPPEEDHTELLHWRHNGRLTEEDRKKIYRGVTGIAFGLSVGNSIVQGLVRAGAMDNVYIGDSDTISLSNLGRLAYHPEDVDRLKTEATADSITRINPYLKVNILPKGYDETTADLLRTVKPKFIVEEVDSPFAKAQIERDAIENGIPIFTVADMQNAELEVRRHDKEKLEPFGGRLTLDQYNALLGGHASQAEVLRAMVGIVGQETVLDDTELLESMMDPRSGGFPQLYEIVTAGAAISTSAIVAFLKGRDVKTGIHTYAPNDILGLGHPYPPEKREAVKTAFKQATQAA